jgi:hypothetical protein
LDGAVEPALLLGERGDPAQQMLGLAPLEARRRNGRVDDQGQTSHPVAFPRQEVDRLGRGQFLGSADLFRLFGVVEEDKWRRRLPRGGALAEWRGEVSDGGQIDHRRVDSCWRSDAWGQIDDRLAERRSRALDLTGRQADSTNSRMHEPPSCAPSAGGFPDFWRVAQRGADVNGVVEAPNSG